MKKETKPQTPAKKQEKKEQKANQDTDSGKQLLAAILVRGMVRVKTPIKDTLKMLKLFSKNSCTVMQQSQANKGMLNKVKDYIAYGEIDNETLKILAEKRNKQEYSSKSYKSFRLNPPKGGFERKGIKKPFSKGGALGYRGSKINSLIKKMV